MIHGVFLFIVLLIGCGESSSNESKVEVLVPDVRLTATFPNDVLLRTPGPRFLAIVHPKLLTAMEGGQTLYLEGTLTNLRDISIELTAFQVWIEEDGRRTLLRNEYSFLPRFLMSGQSIEFIVHTEAFSFQKDLRWWVVLKTEEV